MHKSIIAVLLLGLASSCLAQTRPRLSEPNNSAIIGSSASAQPVSPIDDSRGVTLQTLAENLNLSFEAIADARNEKGYVRDTKLLKTHTANLKAFQKALKRNRPKDDGMAQLFHDVKETYYAFEEANDAPNNPCIYITMDVRESFAAHTAILRRFTAAVSSETQSQDLGRGYLTSHVGSCAENLRRLAGAQSFTQDGRA